MLISYRRRAREFPARYVLPRVFHLGTRTSVGARLEDCEVNSITQPRAVQAEENERYQRAVASLGQQRLYQFHELPRHRATGG